MGDQVETGALPFIARTQMALVAVWMAVVLAALGGLWVYKLQPGRSAELRERWPADSGLTASSDRPTLVMFAHPRCPCTRASLAELRVVLSRFAGRIATYVVFMRPSGSSSDWSQTDTWAAASSLAGVRLAVDTDGREAQRFGATTSGHLVLHDSGGRLLFSGGITVARGHEGANPELDRLIRLLERETAGAPAVASAAASAAPAPERPGPVYGCPLEEDPP